MRVLGVILAIVFVLAVVVSAISCTKDAVTNQGSLENVTWLLEFYGTAGNMTAVAEGRNLTLYFNSQSHRFSGESGVNYYEGPYEIDGSRLTITKLITTQVGGPEPFLSQEETYQHILASAQAFEIQGEMLTITGNKGILIFAKD